MHIIDGAGLVWRSFFVVLLFNMWDRKQMIKH